MRRLLLVLMLVLLPLRGWVGDAMATQMAAPALVQQTAGAGVAGIHTHNADTPTHPHSGLSQADTATTATDCAGHTGSGSSSPADALDCQSCVACQACHTVALAVPVHIDTELSKAPGEPLSVVSRFTSADRALGLKPPIS